ncbi:MAG: hypothetical protein IT445_20130 [Phycisphaeraceae bacterium]|nr:hypothetical protein [Phycisphaeraceae bacterium]
MKLCTCTFALAAGILWSLSVLLVGLANLMWPPYGQAFLEIVASIYPGYQATGVGTGIGNVITGTLYALADGFIAGLVFAWLYNMMSRCCKCKGGICKPAPSDT